MPQLPASQSDKVSTLTLRLCLLYSMPAVVFAFLYTPIAILQGIYAKYYGISLVSIAAVIFVTRVFDAVLDPLIGIFSDRYQRNHGSRKLFIVVGGVFYLLAAIFLYSPFGQPTVIYFGFWLLIFYVGWTLFEIPHLSWGSELATDTADKNRLFSTRTAAGYIGLLLFYCIPLLPFFDSPEITPETLRWCGLITAAILMPVVYASLKTVPNGKVLPATKPNASQGVSIRGKVAALKKALIPFITNKPLIIFLGVYICVGLGVGMWYGLIFIFVDTYLGLGALFAEMFLYAFFIGAISTPLWAILANTIGKSSTWGVAILLLLASFIYTGLLEIGNVDFVDLLFIKSLNTLGFSGMTIMLSSILSDIVDYSTWKYRINAAARYFSIQTFVYKFIFAIGAAFGLAVAGWYGFDATLVTQTAGGVNGMYIGIAWMPIGFAIMALILIPMLPLNQHRHTVIHRRLQSLSLRSFR